MKNLIITTLFAIFTITAVQGQVIGTFTHAIEGGVRGTATEFTPTFELYALDGDNDLNTLIFNNKNISENTSITITNTDENANFDNFIQILTASDKHLLRVGHNIGGVKTKNASSISGWFGETTDFIGQEISHITITYTKVNFETTDNWTAFGYELTVEVYGTEGTAIVSNNK